MIHIAQSLDGCKPPLPSSNVRVAVEPIVDWTTMVPLWWIASTPCRHCGLSPLDEGTFEMACRKADRRQPQPDAKTLRLRRLLDDNVSLDRVWNELNDPRNRPTPQVTVEAVMYSVRTRGLAALKEHATIERLSRCDAAALTQIDQRIAKLGAKK